ncbi:hypothetical protein [Streptomyces cinereospinus]|uniref:Zf-HC2 domain-containing protein n=1 Tax=Streptomyces cinereospinus TaxID=285561 RepID=A0ABV5N7K7_9ACTN
MAHVEPAHLVELALGHAASAADETALRHIAGCRHCREELAHMRRVVSTARGAGPAERLTVPPERIWERIAIEHGAGDPAPTRSGTDTRGPCGTRRTASLGRGTARTRAGCFLLGLLGFVRIVRRLARGHRRARPAQDGGAGRRADPPNTSTAP